MSITTPYAQAWDEYHRHGPPGWEWHEVIAEHFRHGVVISMPDCFVLARRVNIEDPDSFILSPLQFRENGNAWMLWIAAGKLGALIRLLEAHPSEWVCYTRRASTVLRRIPSSSFLRHGLPENPETPTARAAADLIDGPGKSGCRSGSPPPAGETL